MWQKLKKAHKSRTIWFGIALAILSVLQDFIFSLPYSPKVQAIIGCTIAVIIVLLRFVTTDALDKK